MSEFTHSVAKEAACLMLYALTSERVSNDRPTRFTGLHIYIIWGILRTHRSRSDDENMIMKGHIAWVGDHHREVSRRPTNMGCLRNY